MKKILLYTVILISGIFFTTSCEKDEIGGAETEAMAGEWYVTGIAVDTDGNVVYGDDDLFGIGSFHLDTYNTSSNSTTEMWINDNNNFQFGFSAKMNVDLNAMTFQATDALNTLDDSKLTITDGKILYGAATTPTGAVADSIVFTINFEGDTYPADYGYAAYRVAGFRYTGFPEDN